MSWKMPAAITALVFGGLALSRKKIRFLGDHAQVDDEVIVPPTALASAPVLAALGPAGASFGFMVTSAADDTVTGVPVAFYVGGTRTPIPGGGAPFTFGRAVISGIMRDGKAVTL